MADWRFWGKKPTPEPGAKPTAKKPAPKGRALVAQSDRAKLIAQGLAAHRLHGAALRATLDRTIADLERAQAKLLRNPQALDRLLSLARARRALRAMLGSDLRRYLVLTGLREWLEQSGRPNPPATGKATQPRRSVVVRR